MPTPIFDFHTHFSFKPANSKNYKSGKMPDIDHYFERFRTEGELGISVSNMVTGVLKTSQTHGEAAHEGQLRIICNSMYPLEQEFTAFIPKEIANLTGHSVPRIKQIKRDKISYFNHLQEIYKSLLSQHNKKFSPESKAKYVMVKNYNQILKERKKNINNLCIINSIEGAHSFASDIKNDKGEIINLHTEEKVFLKLKTNKSESLFGQHLNATIQNIQKIKNTWEYPPFFVTFSHHYYNHLSGHSPSLGFFINLIVNQSGNTKTKEGRNISFFKVGLRPWGHMVMNQLLSRMDAKGKKVPRILIDTKHLSVQARIDYHAIQKVESDIKDMALPIIQSHTAVSGRKSMQASVDVGMDYIYGEKSRSKYFNPTELNLFDDEIIDIVASDGMMGIMLDEKRIVGKKIPPESGFKNKRAFKKEAKKSQILIAKVVDLKHKILWKSDRKNEEKNVAKLKVLLEKTKKDLKNQQEAVKPAFVSILFRQLFHIVQTAGESAWNHVSLGTDYEGVINPMDIYPQSKDLKNIENDLIDFWEKQRSHKDVKIKRLYEDMLFGNEPKELVCKFLWNNANDFLKKYFTDEYLLEGINPV